MPVLVKDFCAQSVVEGFWVLLEWDDSRVVSGDFAGDVPGGIGAPVVEDEDAIAPTQIFLEGEAHDVGFVFDEAEAEDAHECRGGNAVGWRVSNPAPCGEALG